VKQPILQKSFKNPELQDFFGKFLESFQKIPKKFPIGGKGGS
jgi:hypothetical protein